MIDLVDQLEARGVRMSDSAEVARRIGRAYEAINKLRALAMDARNSADESQAYVFEMEGALLQARLVIELCGER